MTDAKQTQGFQPVIPYIQVEGAAAAIDLYVKALGAKELSRIPTSDGRIMHACIEIGGMKLFISDCNAAKGCPATQSSFYLYLKDVDAAFKQAKSAGFSEMMAPQDMFWGDRMGALKDAYGNTWSLATHLRDLSLDEVKEAAKTFDSSRAA